MSQAGRGKRNLVMLEGQRSLRPTGKTGIQLRRRVIQTLLSRSLQLVFLVLTLMSLDLRLYLLGGNEIGL